MTFTLPKKRKFEKAEKTYIEDVLNPVTDHTKIKLTDGSNKILDRFEVELSFKKRSLNFSN